MKAADEQGLAGAPAAARDCRICLEPEREPGRLVEPCLCTGTCGFVHVECLRERHGLGNVCAVGPLSRRAPLKGLKRVSHWPYSVQRFQNVLQAQQVAPFCRAWHCSARLLSITANPIILVTSPCCIIGRLASRPSCISCSSPLILLRTHEALDRDAKQRWCTTAVAVFSSSL